MIRRLRMAASEPAEAVSFAKTKDVQRKSPKIADARVHIVQPKMLVE